MRQFLTLGALLLISQSGWCWGTQGHMIVAQIAEDNLTPNAKRAVTKLLPGLSLAEVANWADSIKGDPEWAHTKPWHFADIPDDEDYGTAPQSQEGDVVVAITDMVRTLKDSGADLIDKQSALKFIIHFMGDIHQPLHVGRPDDHGGNSIRVTFEGRQTNLHSLWDSGMIMKNPKDYKQYARDLQTQSLLGGYDIPEVAFSTIIKEDMSLRRNIYDFKPVTEGPVILDANYYRANLALMNSRLLSGGKRLADMLNQIFR